MSRALQVVSAHVARPAQTMSLMSKVLISKVLTFVEVEHIVASVQEIRWKVVRILGC